MLYEIQSAPAGGHILLIDDKPVYRICRQPGGDFWVLQPWEGLQCGLDKDRSVDLLIDRTAESLRRAGHLARVSGGVLVWVRAGAVKIKPVLYLSGTGHLCCLHPRRTLSEHPVHHLGLDVSRTRTATLAERMAAGDASCDAAYYVMFVPTEPKRSGGIG